MIDSVILEAKHENSLINKIVLEQEQLSEAKRNQIKQLEAQIELLASETKSVISTNTQASKDDAAGQRATLQLGKQLLFSNNSFYGITNT